jgi:hypothetical protein
VGKRLSMINENRIFSERPLGHCDDKIDDGIRPRVRITRDDKPDVPVHSMTFTLCSAYLEDGRIDDVCVSFIRLKYGDSRMRDVASVRIRQDLDVVDTGGHGGRVGRGMREFSAVKGCGCLGFMPLGKHIV